MSYILEITKAVHIQQKQTKKPQHKKVLKKVHLWLSTPNLLTYLGKTTMTCTTFRICPTTYDNHKHSCHLNIYYKKAIIFLSKKFFHLSILWTFTERLPWFRCGAGFGMVLACVLETDLFWGRWRMFFWRIDAQY